jgi:hypothetical protein
MLFQPTLRVLKGNERVLLLAPVRRPCCLELFCCQNIPFCAPDPLAFLTRHANKNNVPCSVAPQETNSSGKLG